MIALKSHTEEFENLYFSTIWEKILHKASLQVAELERAFPEAIEAGNVKESFFRDIILLPCEELRHKSESVDLYYTLTYICCFDLMKQMRGNYTRSEYKEVRNFYFERINQDIEIFNFTERYKKSKTLTSSMICKSNNSWKAYLNEIRKIYTTRYKCLKNIFWYDDDVSSEIKTQIVKDLNVSVCPYCNRQYINVFQEKDGQRTIADMDHFLPKSQYVLWSDSLYNLVPSCKVCNMLFKGKRMIDMFSPYERGFDDNAYFFIDYDKDISVSELLGWSQKDVKISVKTCDDVKSRKKLKSEIEAFRIEEVYAIHSEYVKNILYKNAMIERTVAEQIVDNINKKFSYEVITLAEVKNILYGMDLENVDYNNVPLSKLTFDVLNESIRY